MKIFALPFAGGDAYCYRQLRDQLPASIDFQTLELPGRGRRSREPLLRDIRSMAQEALGWIRPHTGAPYLLFGHSMGALIGFELTRLIESEILPSPLCLLVSGRTAPRIPLQKRRWDLPPEQFRQALRELGACPEEVLQHEELMAYVEPVLRADFEAVERYAWQPGLPLNTPLSVWMGDREDFTRAEATDWQLEASQPVDLQVFPGGHFFLFEHSRAIARLLANISLIV